MEIFLSHRLLSTQTSSHQHRLFYCNTCLHQTTSKDILKKHMEVCGKAVSVMPAEADNIIKFKNFEKQIPVPFCLYVDFECILEDVDDESSGGGKYVKRHIPCAYGIHIKSSFDDRLNKYIKYIARDSGDNVAKHFATTISEISRNLYKDYLEPIVDMSPLTPLEENNFQSATSCHICGKLFSKDNSRVREI